MSSQIFGASKNCPRCGSRMNPTSVKSGGRVGWFCGECNGLLPNEGYDAITHEEDFN